MRHRVASIAGAVLVAGAALVASAQPCAACSCAISTPEEHAARATEVFLGRVTGIGELTREHTEQGDWKITFAVERVWKGPIQLSSWALGGAEQPVPGEDYIVYNTCDIMFSEGDRYLIVLESGGRGTGSCGITTSWDNASPLLDLFGQGVGIEVDAGTHARAEALIERTRRLPFAGGLIGVAARAVDLGQAINVTDGPSGG